MDLITIINIITAVWTILSIPYFIYSYIIKKWFPYNLKFVSVLHNNSKHSFLIENVGNMDLPPSKFQLVCFGKKRHFIFENIGENLTIENGIKRGEKYEIPLFKFDLFPPNSNPSIENGSKWYIRFKQENSDKILYKNNCVGTKLYRLISNKIMFSYSRMGHILYDPLPEKIKFIYGRLILMYFRNKYN